MAVERTAHQRTVYVPVGPPRALLRVTGPADSMPAGGALATEESVRLCSAGT